MVRVIGSGAVSSGVMVDEGGLVLTGYRAVADNPTVLVEMLDGSKSTGIVLGVDSIAGLAIVKINGEGYPSLSLGDSTSLEPGAPLLTLGFPEQGGVGEIEWEINDPPAQWFTVGPREGILYLNTDDFLPPGYVGGPTVGQDGGLVGLATATGLIITAEYLEEVVPTLREGLDVSASVREDILYTWLETTLSESFLFATDEEGNGRERGSQAEAVRLFRGAVAGRDQDRLLFAQGSFGELGHIHCQF